MKHIMSKIKSDIHYQHMNNNKKRTKEAHQHNINIERNKETRGKLGANKHRKAIHKDRNNNTTQNTSNTQNNYNAENYGTNDRTHKEETNNRQKEQQKER